jgi:Xaa-Pro dipeptidase
VAVSEQALTNRVSRLTVPNLAEVDHQRLRRERLARLQDKLVLHDMAVAVFFNQANIRYATGTDVMGAWSSSAHPRCSVVPAEGAPMLFEYQASVHVSRRLVDDVRRMPEAPGDWVAQLVSVLADLGASGRRIAVDVLTAARTTALLAAGFTLVDSSPATIEARSVKTADEIGLFKINGAIGDAMLHGFESSVRPGIREYELLAVLSDILYRHHGEGLFTRLVASGKNTNPWMAEAHDKIVMPGDLVAVDTDAYGYEGYVIDVCRTFLCGRRPTPSQQEAYKVAYDAVQAMRQTLRPGLSFEDFARSLPPLPARYREQKYPVMVHSAGLEDEDPSIPYVEDVDEGRATFPQYSLAPGMVLCLECYAGAVGEPSGVKLEDQVLVTDDGCELLSTYPYDEGLLGR